MKELGISQAELARRAKVSTASLSEALDPESKQSTLVPSIHKALGWPPPRPVLLSPDAEEMLSLYLKADERYKGALIERARMYAEELAKKAPR